MVTLALYLASLASTPVPTCETYAPRLDGTQVTVCGGNVVRVTMARRVMVFSIDGTVAHVWAEDDGAEWDIDSSRLPAGTEPGDMVLLGVTGAMRSAKTLSDPELADVYDPMNATTTTIAGGTR